MTEDMLGLSALTPLAQLDRAADFFPRRTAYRFEGSGSTYTEFREQVQRFAAHLLDAGIRPGGRVAVLARNTPLSLTAHFAVPYVGAVLVALNHRLAAAELRTILRHSDTSLLLVDEDLAELGLEAAEFLPVNVRVASELAGQPTAPVPTCHAVDDELALISLNYTSGTTGVPKGVMYRHRGAYLQSLAMAYHARLEPGSVYLWTLPMFHCNGWTFPWAVAAAGGTSLCTASTDPDVLWRLIHKEGVTHFCAAPTLLSSLLAATGASRSDREIRVATGGAPPTPALLRRAEQLGLSVIHLYGLTETYGPSLICDWQPEWSSLSAEDQAQRLSRQGIPNITAPRVRLAPPLTGTDAADGTALEELVVEGNTVMAGYFRDPTTTEAAIVDGGLRTGDLAIQHDDAYFELRDRAKDIIISGGENVSSVEVEKVLSDHPAVVECAVVGRPDQKWGEVSVAFVTLDPQAGPVAPEDLVSFVRERLAGFKAPKDFVFGDLPKTATGKIQKFELRRRAAAP